MENKKLELIGQLMEELQDLMGPSEGDFSERLGREKPKGLEVVKMGVIGDEEEMPMGDMGMEEDEEYCDNPEDKLKSRLMKLRG